MLFRPLEAPRKKRTSGAEKPLLSDDEAKRAPAVVLSAPLVTSDPKQRVAESAKLSSSLHDVSARKDEFSDLRKTALLTSSHHDLTAQKSSHHQFSPKQHEPGHRPRVAGRVDQFYTGSVQNLPEYNPDDPAAYTASMTRLDTDDDVPQKSGSTAAGNEDACAVCASCLTLEKRQSLEKTLDLSIFKDVFFELFTWSNFLTNFTFFIPFMFLPDRAVTLGESEARGAMLVSILGIFNTAG